MSGSRQKSPQKCGFKNRQRRFKPMWPVIPQAVHRLCLHQRNRRPYQAALCDGAISKAAGLRRIRFHDLRHSCASLMLANGVPMKQIQDWLGHSDFSTTANIYAHLDYSTKLSSAAPCFRDSDFRRKRRSFFSPVFSPKTRKALRHKGFSALKFAGDQNLAHMRWPEKARKSREI